MLPTIRSNAARVTLPDGVASPATLCTSSQPCSRAASMKAPISVAVPSK